VEDLTAMDYFSRALSVLASVLLASVPILGPARFAFAQDADDEGVNSEDLTQQPKVLVPDIAGCWQGDAFNDSQGNTSISFFFGQAKNKIKKKQSSLDLESAVPVTGHISGTIKLTQFTFHGKVAKGSNIKGTGFFQSDNSLTGNYHYTGLCFEHQFTGGDFSKVVFIGATCLGQSIAMIALN
jgi:hypothetical protein